MPRSSNAIRDLKYGVGLNHLPSGRFPANAAWLAVQVMAHLARWTARIGLGELVVTTKTLRRRFFSLAGRITKTQGTLTLHLPKGWAESSAPWSDCSPAAPFADAAFGVNAPPDSPTAWPSSGWDRVSPAAICPTISAATREPSTSLWRSCHDPHPPKSGGVRALQPIIHASHPLRHQPPRILSVDRVPAYFRITAAIKVNTVSSVPM